MHLATYTSADAGRMLAHYDRSIGERDNIDRDGEVRNLAPEFAGGCRARFAELCDGLDVGPKTRPLADFIVTMPPNFGGDMWGFFRASYDELAARVGEGNVVCAYVHLDEPKAQPHMHFAFVPVVEAPAMTNDKSRPLRWTLADEKKNPEHKAGAQKTDSKGTPRYVRVPLLDSEGKPVVRRTACASKMFSRQEMREIHPRMEAALCERLGVSKVGLVLDSNDPKKKLSSLRHDEYERVTAEIAAAEDRLERLRREEERADREIAELEPAAETLSESARAILSGRSDGGREEALASEIEGLRKRISAAEGEKAELERGVRELGERACGLRARCEAAREQVRVLAERVRGFVDHVGERVAATLARYGVRAYAGAAPLSEHVADVRDASRELGRATHDRERGRGWDMSR